MFAVANRRSSTVSFDPFDTAHPAFALNLPLFMLIFVLVVLGVVIGGIAAWLRQQMADAARGRADAEARECAAGSTPSAAPHVRRGAATPPPFAVPPAAVPVAMELHAHRHRRRIDRVLPTRR